MLVMGQQNIGSSLSVIGLIQILDEVGIATENSNLSIISNLVNPIREGHDFKENCIRSTRGIIFTLAYASFSSYTPRLNLRWNSSTSNKLVLRNRKIKMSGVSLAVAPGSTPGESEITMPAPSLQYKPFRTSTGVFGSLRVIELQLVAFIMVFSFSGLVPLLDLIFPAFASAYIVALSRFSFPVRSNIKTTANPELFQGGSLFGLYVFLGTTIGLFLPLAYVLGGFARGDDHAVRSATPHLFLISFQILTENIISGLSLFSPPVRALVPMIYTVRRIFVILDWMQDVWVNKTLPFNAAPKDVVWYWFGRSLAAANLVYFSINLFCFLIPRFLPKAFERYLNERDEIRMKMSEDISVASQPTTEKKTD